MKRTPSGTLAALLLLTACGDTDEPAPSETSGTMDSLEAPGEQPKGATGGYGKYVMVPETGGTITITLSENPAEPELVERAEAMREAAGFQRGQWIPIEVDNTDGTDTILIDYGIEVVNAEGATTEAKDPIMAMDDWVSAIGDAELTDDLYFTWSDQTEEQIRPGAKYSGYVLADEPIGEPARVFYNGVEGYLAD